MDSHRLYAGKCISKESLVKASARKKLLNEIKIHRSVLLLVFFWILCRSISHPGVVKFERFFEDRDNVYILLELCTNQTMMELLKRRKRLTGKTNICFSRSGPFFLETEVQCYMWQLVNVLENLHSQCIIHRGWYKVTSAYHLLY